MFLLSCSRFDQYYFRQVTKLIKDKIEIYYIIIFIKKIFTFYFVANEIRWNKSIQKLVYFFLNI